MSSDLWKSSKRTPSMPQEASLHQIPSQLVTLSWTFQPTELLRNKFLLFISWKKKGKERKKQTNPRHSLKNCYVKSSIFIIIFVFFGCYIFLHLADLCFNYLKSMDIIYSKLYNSFKWFLIFSLEELYCIHRINKCLFLFPHHLNTTMIITKMYVL